MILYTTIKELTMINSYKGDETNQKTLKPVGLLKVFSGFKVRDFGKKFSSFTGSRTRDEGNGFTSQETVEENDDAASYDLGENLTRPHGSGGFQTWDHGSTRKVPAVGSQVGSHLDKHRCWYDLSEQLRVRRLERMSVCDEGFQSESKFALCKEASRRERRFLFQRHPNGFYPENSESP
ncbi:hypothetical protein VNO77_20090 [Canavalia gladiata]|uniref:Uncharacterized protein n=1 Tax=Canavalia gladiata TaxID=3824 RepID=A0AAN9QJ30_CANGL